MASYNMDSYIDVPTRIADFRRQYPDGSLQPVNPERPFQITTIKGTEKDGQEAEQTFIVYAAAAYRWTDDPRPGIGLAYEVFPGRTSFTRGSELMNAETSAWGRAIIAALAADSRKGIASAEEVRNRKAERELPRNRDGSISRSRAGDEELAAAGSMTREQYSEHTQLVKDATALPRRAERSSDTSDADPWMSGGES